MDLDLPHAEGLKALLETCGTPLFGSRPAGALDPAPRNRGYYDALFPAYRYLFDLANIAKMQARKIRILAADQNPLIREGLRLLIQLQPDMELAAAAASGKEAVQAFARHRPDVTLMDLDLPHAEGFTALQQILQIDSAACIIGLLPYSQGQCTGWILLIESGSCPADPELQAESVETPPLRARPGRR
jgi:CheY-like chemotaxis protein